MVIIDKNVEKAQEQVQQLDMSQIKSQIQHLSEEISFCEYDMEIISRSVEFLDSRLKYELLMTEKELAKVKEEINNAHTPIEMDEGRNKKWMLEKEIEKGLQLKAIRKRKQMMAQFMQVKKSRDDMRKQLEMFKAREAELTK